MACKVKFLIPNLVFIANFIYVPANKSQDKNDSWEELISFVNSLTLPFVILGDFNEISSCNDKLGELFLTTQDFLV